MKATEIIRRLLYCADNTMETLDAVDAARDYLETQGWQPIETAPKGYYKEIQTSKGIRKQFVRQWCLINLDDKVYYTHKLECGRWNGLSKDKNKPTHWQPLPEPFKQGE